MVAMAMRDEDIVDPAEVFPQPLGVTDKHITGSCIKQDSMLLRLEKDRKAVLRFVSRVAGPVI